MLSRGDLRLVLSAPGGRPAGRPGDARRHAAEPGGWNRFSLEVDDLAALVERLRAAGAHFRNEIVTGVGGKQILLDDPSGNPVELFEPTLPEARLAPTRSDLGFGRGRLARARSRYDERRVSLQTGTGGRREPGVARHGLPLSRRDETPVSPVRPIARVSRLGVAATTLSPVCRYPALSSLPDSRRSRRWICTASRHLRSGVPAGDAAQPLGAAALGDMLRHALGLSAWKRYDASRSSLRVNPSSGNLHPTEAYVVSRALRGLADRPAVYHYAADRHALELRCCFDGSAWQSAFGGRRMWCSSR